MSQQAVKKIAALGGLAFEIENGYAATIPLDGDWVVGVGADLDDVLDIMQNSDGKAMEVDGVHVVPYLDRDDAVAEMETYRSCTLSTARQVDTPAVAPQKQAEEAAYDDPNPC